MRLMCQQIVPYRRLLVEHVNGYSRHAEAALDALAERHRRAGEAGVRARTGRRYAAYVPLACLLLLGGRCGTLRRDGPWFDAPTLRISGFTTETECWTAGKGPAPPRLPEPPVVAVPAQCDDAPFVRELKQIFEQEGIPAALVWIAEVESAFNPNARSDAGAMGLFQLMPATARRFGLRTGRVDDRRDPAVSARAAARYLRSLHARFGSWPLAVAAYNAGEERVAGTLRARNATTYSEIMAWLPAETRSYVPRVLNLVSDREHVDAIRLPAPSRS